MNCKQGDLAVVISSSFGNEGRIVHCVRYLGELPFLNGVDHAWEIEPEIPRGWVMPGTYWANKVPDHQLRPIRDPGDDATDEMVKLLGKPERVTA